MEVKSERISVRICKTVKDDVTKDSNNSVEVTSITLPIRSSDDDVPFIDDTLPFNGSTHTSLLETRRSLNPYTRQRMNYHRTNFLPTLRSTYDEDARLTAWDHIAREDTMNPPCCCVLFDFQYRKTLRYYMDDIDRKDPEEAGQSWIFLVESIIRNRGNPLERTLLHTYSMFDVISRLPQT